MVTDKTKWFFNQLESMEPVTPDGVGELLIKFLNKKPDLDELTDAMAESVLALRAAK